MHLIVPAFSAKYAKDISDFYQMGESARAVGRIVVRLLDPPH
jgi:hypothetical protein